MSKISSIIFLNIGIYGLEVGVKGEDIVNVATAVRFSDEEVKHIP